MGVQVEDGGVGHCRGDGAAVGQGEHGSGETGSLQGVIATFEGGSEVFVGGVGIVVVDGVTDRFELGGSSLGSGSCSDRCRSGRSSISSKRSCSSSSGRRMSRRAASLASLAKNALASSLSEVHAGPRSSAWSFSCCRTGRAGCVLRAHRDLLLRAGSQSWPPGLSGARMARPPRKGRAHRVWFRR